VDETQGGLPLFAGKIMDPTGDWLIAGKIMDPTGDWLIACKIMEPTRDWLIGLQHDGAHTKAFENFVDSR
jgi:hypothetical protein